MKFDTPTAGLSGVGLTNNHNNPDDYIKPVTL